PLFAGEIRLVVRTDEETGRCAPDVAATVEAKIAPLVQVSRCNDCNIVAEDALEKLRPRLGFDGPLTHVAFGGIVDEERPVREPRQSAPVRARRNFAEPCELSRLLVVARAEQHRTETEEPPPLDVARPAICTDVPAPA